MRPGRAGRRAISLVVAPNIEEVRDRYNRKPLMMQCSSCGIQTFLLKMINVGNTSDDVLVRQKIFCGTNVELKCGFTVCLWDRSGLSDRLHSLPSFVNQSFE